MDKFRILIIAFVLMVAVIGFSGYMMAGENRGELPEGGKVLSAKDVGYGPEDYVSLFYEIAVGSYSILYIHGDGKATFTNYHRSLFIGKDKRGRIPRDAVDRVFSKIQEVNFFQMEDGYKLKYDPNAPKDGAYYTVRVSMGGKVKSVLANVFEMPMDFEELVQVLYKVVPYIPDSGLSGPFIRASEMKLGEPHMGIVLSKRESALRSKRGNLPSYYFDSEQLKEYPFLQSAIEKPESLVFVQHDQAGKLFKLRKGNRRFYVNHDGKDYLILVKNKWN